MRIHLKTTPSTAIVPFNHQHKLAGVLHKWFGWNNFHDDISLYSFSRLQGAKRDKNGIIFPDGASWFISSWNDELLKQSIASIQRDPTLFAELTVNEIVLQQTPDLTNRNQFGIASPIYIQPYLTM